MRDIARRGGITLFAVAAAVLLGVGTASAAPGDGSAFGVEANVTLLGMPLAHVGPVPEASTSGPTSATAVNIDLPNILTVAVASTSASLDPTTGTVTSDADTADIGLPLLSALGNVGIKVVDASCTATTSGITGTTTIIGASLGALPVPPLNPPPNTQIPISLPVLGNVATLTFNEQIHNADGSLTVNGLHVHLLGSGLLGGLGSGDVYLSSATCGPAA